MEQKDEASPAASAAASTAASAASATAPAKPVLTQEDINVIESLVEANVQRSLDSLDAWKLTGPFRGDQPGKPSDPSKCSKDKHNCDLEASDINRNYNCRLGCRRS